MRSVFIYLPLFILGGFLTSGCEDQITGATKIKEVTTPSICPPSTYPEPPSVDFAGAQTVDGIEQSRFQVHWNKNEEARAYMVFVGKEGEPMALHTTAHSSASSALINGLTPQTQYKVSVKLVDARGLYDVNETVIRATTASLPSYRNSSSLYFDGFASASLGPSRSVLPSRAFTISLWFKTSHRQNRSDARLINFHHGFSAGSALALGVRADSLFLAYKKDSGEFLEIKHNTPYFDGQWHHIAATYDGNELSLHFDGTKKSVELEGLSAFGEHPAHIGSYTGDQRGFTGNIDEVSLWTSAMDTSKIAELRNDGPIDLLQHRQASSLRVWHRMGDDPRDGASKLQDQMGNAHGSPLNIQTEDFTLDIP